MQASTSLGAPLPNLPTKIILKRLEKLTSPDMTLYRSGQVTLVRETLRMMRSDLEAREHIRGLICPYWGKSTGIKQDKCEVDDDDDIRWKCFPMLGP